MSAALVATYAAAWAEPDAEERGRLLDDCWAPEGVYVDPTALHADLVVDAMGRGSRLPRLLAAAGAEPPAERAEDSGFLYYTRFFRGAEPPVPRAPLLTPIGSFSILTRRSRAAS